MLSSSDWRTYTYIGIFNQKLMKNIWGPELRFCKCYIKILYFHQGKQHLKCSQHKLYCVTCPNTTPKKALLFGHKYRVHTFSLNFFWISLLPVQLSIGLTLFTNRSEALSRLIPTVWEEGQPDAVGTGHQVVSTNPTGVLTTGLTPSCSFIFPVIVRIFSRTFQHAYICNNGSRT